MCNCCCPSSGSQTQTYQPAYGTQQPPTPQVMYQNPTPTQYQDTTAKAARVQVPIIDKDPAVLYRTAERLKKAHKLTEAFNNYQNAAVQGHVQAQFELAVCYMKGEGTLKNEAQAKAWYEKVLGDGYISQDKTISDCQLGAAIVLPILSGAPKGSIIFIDLDGTGKIFSKIQGEENYFKGVRSRQAGDQSKAYEYFSAAYDEKYPLAALEIGLCFLEVALDAESKKEAKQYLTEALNSGIEEARRFIKAMDTIPVDDRIIIDMNDQGDRFARGMLPGEEYYLQSIRLKKELDLQNTSKKSETLTMEQERAKRNAERQPMIFMIMAHEAGFPKASFELGFYYLQLNDTEQAKECFTKAKEKGIKGAEEQLSKLA